MIKQILNLVSFKTSRRKKAKSLSLPYKKQPKKLVFVVLFFTSFFVVQTVTWLLGATSLPVIAQTPTQVTTPQSVQNPEALLEEVRNLYKQQQFPEALNLLKQAVDAFQSQGNSLKRAIALDLQGQIYLAQGQPERAAESFSAAATTYEQGNENTDSAIKSRLNQAEALRKAGFYRRSEDVLEQLDDNLTDQTDAKLRAIALRSQGITQRLIGDLEKAREAIEGSLKIAETLVSPEREENISAAYLMLGNIAKDQGNILRRQNENSETGTQFQEAIAHYQKAAETATTPTVRIEAQLNQLSTFRDFGQPFTSTDQELLRQVRETIDQLPLSQTAVYARINWARMVMEQDNQANFSTEDIVQQLAIAIEQARKLKDPRSESYALGQLGELR